MITHNRDPRRVQFEALKIPKQFNVVDPLSLCARDIVAYMRSKVEKDPWVPIILETKDRPVEIIELEGSRIYWDGINEKKIDGVSGLSVDSYFVVDVTELDPSLDDCGIEELTMNFRISYDIQSFNILITGEDDKGEHTETLKKLRDYSAENNRIDMIFPRFIVMQNKLLPNGLDLSPYAQELNNHRQRNELDSSHLDAVLQRLDSKLEKNITALQDLEELHSMDIRLLTMYLTLKYNLPPVYVNSFIAEYIELGLFYPYKKLSLFERLSFLYRMPQLIGYIGLNYGFTCYAKVNKKIFPAPHYVFNLETMELEKDLDSFSLDSPELRFGDYRRFFKESQTPIISGRDKNNKANTLMDAAGGDVKADENLVNLFMKLTSLVNEEPVFLSVKNTVLAYKNKTRYLLYCPEECGLDVVFASEYFGQLNHIIAENEFGRIIDAQMEAAILRKARSRDSKEGNKMLVAKWKEFDPKKALQPAAPLETILYVKLLPFSSNGLSYYDKMLRCCEDVLPIITSTDSKLCDVNPLLDEVSLESLRKDPQARKVINCFGTLNKPAGPNTTLPLTYRAFEDGGLL